FPGEQGRHGTGTPLGADQRRSYEPCKDRRESAHVLQHVGELNDMESMVDGLLEGELVGEILAFVCALSRTDRRQGSRGAREFERSAVDAFLDCSALEALDFGLNGRNF